MRDAAPNTICPELVDGLSSFLDQVKQVQSFDRLRTNGNRK